METAICGVPIATACVTTFLFWFGLRNQPKIDWLLIAASLAILALTYIALTYLMSMGIGEFIGVGFFITSLLTAVALFFSGLFLTTLVGRERVVISGILTIVSPIILFLGAFWVTGNFAPAPIKEQHGNLLVQALSQYYVDHNRYPEMLIELVPDYVTDLKEPGTVWGWLYVASDDGYSLGYVTWVDRYGYSVEVFGSCSKRV